MKKAFLGFAACALFGAAALAVPQSKSFTGEIMDDACASQGGHSTMADKGESDEHCTRACIKGGSKYVLYDGATKTVYKLDDQQKPDAFAGAQVVVTGTLDAATGTIHVVGIKAAGK